MEMITYRPKEDILKDFSYPQGKIEYVVDEFKTFLNPLVSGVSYVVKITKYVDGVPKEPFGETGSVHVANSSREELESRVREDLIKKGFINVDV